MCRFFSSVCWWWGLCNMYRFDCFRCWFEKSMSQQWRSNRLKFSFRLLLFFRYNFLIALFCGSFSFQLTFKCSGSSHPPPSTLDSHVDPHTGVQLQEVTATISKDLVFEYFGKTPFKCDCHAWSPRGKAKSQSATIEVACKFGSAVFIFFHFILCCFFQRHTINKSLWPLYLVFTWNHLWPWDFVWHVFTLTLICKWMLKI